MVECETSAKHIKPPNFSAPLCLSKPKLIMHYFQPHPRPLPKALGRGEKPRKLWVGLKRRQKVALFTLPYFCSNFRQRRRHNKLELSPEQEL